MTQKAEVDLRETAYYPPSEAQRHLSEAVSNLVAAEQSLRAVLGLLETSGEKRPSMPEATVVDRNS